MSGPVRSMRMRHASGTATTDPNDSKISVNRGVAQFIAIKNTDTTNALEISFNGGRNFFTIPQGSDPLKLNVLFRFIYLRSNAGTATWSALIGEG